MYCYSFLSPQKKCRGCSGRDNRRVTPTAEESRFTSIRTAAGSVVRDVIPASSNLKDGARIWISVVVVIDEEEVWWCIPFSYSIGQSLIEEARGEAFGDSWHISYPNN